jgi:hypothetical protein
MVDFDYVCGVPTPALRVNWRALLALGLVSSPADWHRLCATLDEAVAKVPGLSTVGAFDYARDRAVSGIGWAGCYAFGETLWLSEVM